MLPHWLSYQWHRLSHLPFSNTIEIWWTSGTSCIARVCTNALSSVANQADCNNHVAIGCIYNGNNQCVVKGTCGSYTAAGADDIARGNNCRAMTDGSGNVCWFISGTTCTDRTCTNVPTTPAISGQSTCDAHKNGSCQYNGNAACVDIGACNSYTVAGTIMLSCQQNVRQ